MSNSVALPTPGPTAPLQSSWTQNPWEGETGTEHWGRFH